MNVNLRIAAGLAGMLTIVLAAGGCGGKVTAKGSDTPEAVVDAFVKVVATGDAATYKQLIVHSPTHVEAMEKLPALRVALDSNVTLEQAEKDFVTNWVGMLTEFSKHPNKKFTTVNGDSAAVVVGALHNGEIPSYIEFVCKKIDGQWFMVTTNAAPDAAEYEKKYPLDDLKKTKDQSPAGTTEKADTESDAK